MKNLGERLEQKLHVLVAALIIGWVLLLGFRPVMENVDLGWHVAQGRWMVQHVAFYRTEALAYPNLGRPVIDEYPLFQVMLYAVWSAGLWGPCLFTALVYAGLAALYLRAAAWLGLGSSALLSAAVVLMFLYLQIVAPLRPHIATYLGIAVLGVFLLKHRHAQTWTVFWPMALLQIAWVNSHSGFVIGPGMAGLFGLEMTLRSAWADRAFPWRAARVWLGIFVLLTLACFVNPYGFARLSLPFYQDQLESIRAYVGEMEPLGGGIASLYREVTLGAVLVVAFTLIAHRGATAYSLLLLAGFFYLQSQAAQKAWPVFGVFLPLLVLSSGAFSTSWVPRKAEVWINAAGHFALGIFVGVALIFALDAGLKTSLQQQWKQHDDRRSELSLSAGEWLLAHGLDGRLFHRCEDGGMLQMIGFDHAQVFADTGFGKYDAAFIHEIGLVNERPAFLPHYLSAYQPESVVCGTFCYRWPYYLRQNGWRPVFYSANSSAWLPAASRPDLPSVTAAEIETAFDQDLASGGKPSDIRIFGRNLIALNSLGLEDFAFAKLTGLAPEDHQAGWYWEAARFMCFSDPPFSAGHRDALIQEAANLHDDGVTAEFRATADAASGNTDGALAILEKIPASALDNVGAELLLKIYLAQNRPEALALARRTDCFDLRNGRHWMYLAQAEEQAGRTDAAAVAWNQAVFYYPDDDALIAAASSFATRHGDAGLAQAIAQRTVVYDQQRQSVAR